MKRTEHDSAIILRKEGKSINEIAHTLGVSKASVSDWVRDVPLTIEQRSKLNKRGFSINAIEKRRESRIAKTREFHLKERELGKSKIKSLSPSELFLVGTALYWGEGGKTNRGMARVANSDPHIIAMMMRYFRELYKVPEEKFRGYVHTFSHLNVQEAEKYWSSISGIPRKQLFKTYSKPSKASLGKAGPLPHGTFEIYVCDTKLFLNIMGAIEKLSELSVV